MRTQLYRSSQQLGALSRSILAIGNYDGVHFGHRHILRCVKRLSVEKGCPSVLVTFDPHPVSVMNPGSSFCRLFPVEDMLLPLGELGVDILFVQEFSRGSFASYSPREFVSDWLLPMFCPEDIFVGEDFRFGCEQAGDIVDLQHLGEEFGFAVHTVEDQCVQGERVSSSLIRDYLEEGKVKDAARFLQRPFSITAPVVHGDGIGAQLGVPTANLKIPQTLVPARGVYVGALTVVGEERSKLCVINIGHRPTVSSQKKVSVEAHVLGEKVDLYGQSVRVEFLDFLRKEKKFSSKEELKQQIDLDIQQAKGYR